MEFEPDPLFAGLTRPTVLLGVPVEAYWVIALVPLMLVLTTQHLLFALPIPVLWSIARVICSKDPRMFRYYILAIRTKGVGLNRSLWRCSSYAPIRFRKRTNHVD